MKRPIVYRLDGMEDVRVARNLRYRPDGAAHLLMDVYTPGNLPLSGKRPAVVFIHGNVPPGSPAKDMGIFQSWARLVGARGLIGVTFTHRLGYPKPGLAEAAGDLRAAIDYLRTNAETYAIDANRICLVAFSGGGPLLSDALSQAPSYIRCIVALYAYLDIRHSELYTAHEPQAEIRAFSPVVQLEAVSAIPPMFIGRAGRDATPVLNESIDRFVLTALSRNLPVTIANHPDGVHGFDTETDDGRSREIIRMVLAFMQRHLGLDEF